jgi:hypothetical protein
MNTHRNPDSFQDAVLTSPSNWRWAGLGGELRGMGAVR